MTYESVAMGVQQGGTLFFMAVFILGCAYAFWPSRKADFDAAARLPLEEDDQ